MTIEIVDAMPSHEVEEVAGLFWSSGPKVLRYAYRSPEDWYRIIAREWAQKGGFFSYDRTIVAVDGGAIAGILLGHQGRRYAEIYDRMRARLATTETPDYLAHLDAAVVLLDRLAPYPHEDAFHVLSLAVRPEYQRQGLGRGLIQAAAERAGGWGARCLASTRLTATHP